MKPSHRRAFVAPLVLAATAALLHPRVQAADLHITVRHVVPGQGELLVALFDRADGFPGNPAPALPSRRVKAEGEAMTLSFKGLPEGRWAVMVLQDLNGNGRQDSNALGMPKEPYGASNNRLPLLTPPRFEDSLFTVGPEGATITIDLRRP
jgi:uncharacterized protein (DUF2141 family)